MTKPTLTEHAKMLRARALDVKAGGSFRAMTEGPKLVEDVAALLVAMCDRLDALTPYVDEGGEV